MSRAGWLPVPYSDITLLGAIVGFAVSEYFGPDPTWILLAGLCGAALAGAFAWAMKRRERAHQEANDVRL